MLLFNDTPLIEHSLRIVRAAGAGEVLISGRVGQDFSALDCPVLLDAVPDSGPLGGIERALSVAKHPMVLVLAVDLPHMTAEFLRGLCDEAGDAVDRGAAHRSPAAESGACQSRRGAVPFLSRRPEPLAALYPKQAHEIVKRMLDEKRLAARDFAAACIQRGLACAAPVGPEYERCFSNWNTQEDVATGY